MVLGEGLGRVPPERAMVMGRGRCDPEVIKSGGEMIQAEEEKCVRARKDAVCVYVCV